MNGMLNTVDEWNVKLSLNLVDLWSSLMEVLELKPNQPHTKI